jgi:hypothetical protein
MPPLLGEADVIDDPSFNRTVALHRRQYHLTDGKAFFEIVPSRRLDKQTAKAGFFCIEITASVRWHR